MSMTETPFASEAVVLLRAPYKREDWLKVRTLGVGGSDAATVAGVNKYKSAYALWQEKTDSAALAGQADEPGPESAMYWGHALEDDLDTAFRQVTGLQTVESPGLLRHRERTWQLASPDRIAWRDGEPAGIVEYKTTGSRYAHEWADGEIPIAALLQTQHYLAVTGLRHAWVAALIAGQTFVVRELPRDDTLIGLLTGYEKEFWDSVLAGTPPDPDGTASSAEAIRARYPQARDTGGDDAEPGGVVLGAEHLRDVATIRLVDARLRALGLIREEAKQRLQDALKDEPYGYRDERVVVRWTNRTTRRLDVKALTADHPEIAEKYTVTTDSRVFTLA